MKNGVILRSYLKYYIDRFLILEQPDDAQKFIWRTKKCLRPLRQF